jgi:hypothetical protein
MEVAHSNKRQATEFRQRSPGSPALLFKRIVSVVLGVVVAILGLRFVLELLGANPDAGFTHFIYTLSRPFMAPFTAVFGTAHVNGSGVFEWSVLLAIAVYALIAWGIVALANAVSAGVGTQHVERVERVEERDEEDSTTR